MIRPVKTPYLVTKLYPSFTFRRENSSSIFLTFDDGPDPDSTPQILDLLFKADAKATFFCLGKNLAKHPDIAKEILAQNHTIANHTYSHLDGFKSSTKKYLEDVERCDLELKGLGVKNSFFRPPYGRMKPEQIRKLSKVRGNIFHWSHMSWDFSKQIKHKLITKKLSQASGGSIMLFHDATFALDNLKMILPTVLADFQDDMKFEVLT